MAAIALELVFGQARRNPRLMEKWRAANAWTRFSVLGVLIGLAMGFMLLIGGMEMRWNASICGSSAFPTQYIEAPSTAEFEAQCKGKEYQLIRRLDAFKAQVPTVELCGGWGLDAFHRNYDTDPAVAWVWIVSGLMVLSFCFQQGTGVEGFSVWKILRRGGWRQALVCTVRSWPAPHVPTQHSMWRSALIFIPAARGSPGWMTASRSVPR